MKPSERRVASIATMPGREASLARAVASIADQVDEVRVHFNASPKMRGVTLPDNVIRSWSVENLGDQEKVLRLASAAEAGAWCFTCDDDLIYPPDYCDMLIGCMRRMPRPTALSAHGARLHKDAFRTYYRSRRTFHCTAHVAELLDVDVIGTGCALFHPQGFPFTREDFPAPNMADVWAAIALARAGIARGVIPHARGWLQLADPTNEETIWHASQRADGSHLDTGAAQTEALRTHARLFGLICAPEE